MHYICSYFREILGFVSKVLLPFIANCLNAYDSENFFFTNITLSSLLFTAIVVVVIAIVNIIAFIVLVSTIMPPQLMIRKVLSIGSVAIIVYDDG